MSTRSFGYTMAILAVVIWAGNFVAARAIAFSIPPVQMNFWRWALAFVCILPFALKTWRKDWPTIKQHWLYIAAVGFVGVTCLNAFFYKAGSTTSSINMVLFVPSAPIVIMLLSRLFCAEPITWRRLGGLGIILAGLLLLVSRGDINNILQLRISSGDLWSIAGVISFGVYSFITRYRPQNISASSFLTASFAWGLLLSLPFLVWEMCVLPAPTWNTDVFIAIAYAGIGCSSIAYLLWTKAIDAIGPVPAGMIYYSIPLFTALEGVLILGESINFLHILGGGLMLTGMVLATLPKKMVTGC